jgi:hypothetical protein
MLPMQSADKIVIVAGQGCIARIALIAALKKDGDEFLLIQDLC